jgi:[acyl-carrier-protein] S-malonyltransferase
VAVSGLALLFPGQGGQEPGMLELAAGDPAGAAVLALAAEVLGEPPEALLRRGGEAPYRNAVAQPLVCAAELATWAALRQRLPTPTLLLGYSVGELAAHGVAGTFDASTTLTLAARRATLMDEASPSPGGLLGLRGLPLARIEALAVESGCEVAIVNGPEHAVLGGPRAAIDALVELAAAAGATTVQRLRITVAAHTRHLASAVLPFARVLAAAAPRPASIPVLAGLSGAPVWGGAQTVELLSRQLAERLEWGRCLAIAGEMGCTVFLELGPGTALARMARETYPGMPVRAVSEFRTLDGVGRWAVAALRA